MAFGDISTERVEETVLLREESFMSVPKGSESISIVAPTENMCRGWIPQRWE